MRGGMRWGEEVVIRHEVETDFSKFTWLYCFEIPTTWMLSSRWNEDYNVKRTSRTNKTKEDKSYTVGRRRHNDSKGLPHPMSSARRNGVPMMKGSGHLRNWPLSLGEGREAQRGGVPSSYQTTRCHFFSFQMSRVQRGLVENVLAWKWRWGCLWTPPFEFSWVISLERTSG